jgi:uncharacterized protein YndB with AHSA1/START domain
MIDVTEHINSIRREVGGRVLEVGDARVVTLSRLFSTDLADLWDACTNPERIPRWFLPVSGELKEGGRYQLEGNAGGTITRCDPPHGFDATWEMGGNTSWIELRLTDEGGESSRFQLSHIAPVDDFWKNFGPGALGVGWDSGLIGLTLHLTTRESVDPAEFMKWSTSDEGRQFMTASSNGWYDANVAFGTDENEARASADRTTSFHTGTG